MGLFDKLFPKKHEHINAEQYFKLLTGYTPVFQNWDGKIYESELVRTAIDARARHISKLSVYIEGSAQPKLQTKLRQAPNGFQTWSQFLYRLSTILDAKGTAFILPVYDRYMETCGVTTVLPSKYELVQVDGEPWLKFTFSDGRSTAEELSKVGIMTRFQYDSDLFGSTNGALSSTMKLINLQNQGIEEAVTNSASYRFMAKVNNFAKATDLTNERKRFNEENFGPDADGGGLILFPNTYSEIQQISTKPFTVDAEQMKMIQTNVFNYFGINEKVLQNSATGDELDAFFNGGIEPFAIQGSSVLSKMLFTSSERAHGSEVYLTANRLQYMTVSEKVNLAQQLGDRGMITIDEVRDLFNYPPLPNGAGNKAPIRGEYYFNGEEKQDADQTE
ncbi:MAG TPA: portal protein [Erysipelotrichaceae bacterium]|nr:portal protein [Erysipelotrichaceae bacterium]